LSRPNLANDILNKPPRSRTEVYLIIRLSAIRLLQSLRCLAKTLLQGYNNATMMKHMLHSKKSMSTLLLFFWAIILMGSLLITVMNMSCFFADHQCTQQFLSAGEKLDHRLLFQIEFCFFFFLLTGFLILRPTGWLHPTLSESIVSSWNLSDRELRPPRQSF